MQTTKTILEFLFKIIKSLHVAILKGKEFHNLIAGGKKNIYKNHRYIVSVENGVGAHGYYN